MNLNKTIYKFKYQGINYEVDWLTDATCEDNKMVCDIFNGKGKKAECVGQIIILKTDTKKKIKEQAIAELKDNKE